MRKIFILFAVILLTAKIYAQTPATPGRKVSGIVKDSTDNGSCRRSLGIQAFDVLNQNNFVTRTIDENGFTDTKSNALSRYFMVNFKWTPQKWTGTPPSRNGRQLNRRGDGSFIE